MQSWGVAPIVFSPGTRWRTWGTRPVPIGFCQDSRRGRLAAVSKIGTFGAVGGEREPQVPPLRYPEFPVRTGGVGKLHAAFFTESRKRGRW
jgi:hypothetical protein